MRFHPDSDIQLLTQGQKQVILLLLREGSVRSSDSGKARVLHSLITRGIATAIEKQKYTLTPEWAAVDPALLRGETTKVPRQELPPIPDQPKKIKRAPAEYSNPNWSERIDQILNS